jgi:hypothetical protein
MDRRRDGRTRSRSAIGNVDGQRGEVVIRRGVIVSPRSKAPTTVPVDDAIKAVSFLPSDHEASEMFEMETLAEALESFAGELSASIEAAEEKAMAGAMEIYYAAEKLAQDPEHAHLIPYVEQMRAAYRRDFGKEIPERK